MARFGFCSGFYTAQSVNADAQTCENWYPEADESGLGNSSMVLSPSPGMNSVFGTNGSSVVAEFTDGSGNAWAVLPTGGTLGNGALQQIANNYAIPYAVLTNMAINPAYPVTVGVGLSQALIVNAPNAYVLDFATGVITNVTGLLAQANPYLAAWCDGYFIVVFQNSNEFQISALGDATTWSGLDVAEISVFPGNIVAMLVDHRQIWFWSASKSAVYYDSGASDFPFTPNPSAYIESGTISPLNPQRLDNSVFWISSDDRGALIANRANGFSPVRISTHAIENAWTNYAVSTDATAYAWVWKGHTFWQINFPTAGATWVYDASTSLWHSRSTLNIATGTSGIHRSQCHIFIKGLGHLVGDSVQGVSVMTDAYGQDFLTDGTHPIRRIRRAPHLANEQEWIRHRQLQILVEPGLGAPAPGDGDQYDLRWSDDGGHTWSNTHTKGAGVQGKFKRRLIWWQLGRARDRVYELSTEAINPARVIDAYLITDKDAAPKPRLPKTLAQIA